LPDKDGEAGDIGCIVDAAGCSQADNSGCLDPPVNEEVQEKGPLEARSSFQTEPNPITPTGHHPSITIRAGP